MSLSAFLKERAAQGGTKPLHSPGNYELGGTRSCTLTPIHFLGHLQPQKIPVGSIRRPPPKQTAGPAQGCPKCFHPGSGEPQASLSLKALQITGIYLPVLACKVQRAKNPKVPLILNLPELTSSSQSGKSCRELAGKCFPGMP